MNDLKQTILNAIKQAQDQGYTLVRESYGNVENKCACPLSCVVLANDIADASLIDSGYVSDKATQVLGIDDENWATSFMDGFDGELIDQLVDVNKEAWKLGEQICAETSPMIYGDYMREKGHKNVKWE